MANKKFTPEEMEYLRGSEHVLDVTESCVYFSATYEEIRLSQFASYACDDSGREGCLAEICSK